MKNTILNSGIITWFKEESGGYTLLPLPDDSFKLTSIWCRNYEKFGEVLNRLEISIPTKEDIQGEFNFKNLNASEFYSWNSES